MLSKLIENKKYFGFNAPKMMKGSNSVVLLSRPCKRELGLPKGHPIWKR